MESHMAPNIDPGEMIVEGHEVRSKVNALLDLIKIAWMKENTVTVIFREGARFLPKKVKDDIVRAFEDAKVQDGSFEASSFSSGRVKVESPNVVSYVARSRAADGWLLKVETKSRLDRPLEFKPWLSKPQLREQRSEDDELVSFWVVVVQVSLDSFFYLEAQITKAIGRIIRTHRTEPDRLKPSLGNIKFDLDPAARPNIKDKIWVETVEGGNLKVKLTSSKAPRCGGNGMKGFEPAAQEG
ncbi:hypothetical protein CBR_g39900 [Chara braunii]|uniref:Uncharacterized protein n=1 Tax=Chara braunii TaxID=69332 RepID=A0A388LSX2_CHABU|nr:hypothetical protein CBR_g39900 [Chara braunii]|eukprot:GBG85333.1 hypothetical protein CBR_g39900 [Chara braunii]